jgi:hypothetical protein
MLIGIKKLAKYLDMYFASNDKRSNRPAYVRWYTRLSDEDRVPWADEVFECLESDWAMPYFLPTENYLLPSSKMGVPTSPVNSPFPAKGLFISARGARTRLHVDPWCSDAVLCQIHGSKSFYLFDPEHSAALSHNGEMVDLAEPDVQKFPDFARSKASFKDTLSPGEIILIPAGWAHHFDTIENSISLTWNFVHIATWTRFCRYLADSPSQKDIATIKYFTQTP